MQRINQLMQHLNPGNIIANSVNSKIHSWQVSITVHFSYKSGDEQIDRYIKVPILLSKKTSALDLKLLIAKQTGVPMHQQVLSRVGKEDGQIINDFDYLSVVAQSLKVKLELRKAKL